ncbi:MAG: DUF402 domain-containing protein [Candidatus Lokiarchaeota archaeon]|nr:DUF402 domain-containing protein [Candidatus Lokiarchaeota archaeon]
MYNIKIRGIYSTALTKLMLDNEFEITKATKVIKSRFDLEPKVEIPDIEIFDNIKNKQGVVILGKEKGVELIKDLLMDEFKDIIIRNSESGWNSIYRGKVIKYYPETRSAIMEFYTEKGEFQGILDGCRCDEGEQRVVSIKFPNFSYVRAKLSPKITIPGDYAILIESNYPRISRKISDPEKRRHLMNIANNVELYSDRWNILWRTSVRDMEEEVLIEEVNELNERLIDILRKVDDENETTLYRGSPGFYAEFPYLTKRKLDSIRDEILKTIPYHHFVKSIGKEYSMLIDFSEKMLKEIPESEDSIRDIFSDYVKRNFLNRGKIGIEHVKLDGRIFHLTPGIISEIDKNDGKFKIIRYFKGNSNKLYDGLRVPMESGDYGETEMQLGEHYYFKTTYFNKDHEMKGIYYNINTPIEIYQNMVRYVDLEVDVISMPDGKIRVEDKELLDSFYINGYINLELKNIATDTVKMIVEDLKK